MPLRPTPDCRPRTGVLRQNEGTGENAMAHGEISLPLIQAEALHTVSSLAETGIMFSPAVIAEHQNLAGVEVQPAAERFVW